MMPAYHIAACSREAALVSSNLPYSTFVCNMHLFLQKFRAMFRFYSAKLCYNWSLFLSSPWETAVVWLSQAFVSMSRSSRLSSSSLAGLEFADIKISDPWVALCTEIKSPHLFSESEFKWVQVCSPIVFPLLHWVSEVTGVLKCQCHSESYTSRWEFFSSYSEKDGGAIKLIQVTFFFLLKNCYYFC